MAPTRGSKLSNLEMGFVRTIGDKDGNVLPSWPPTVSWPFPFRARSDDAKPQIQRFLHRRSDPAEGLRGSHRSASSATLACPPTAGRRKAGPGRMGGTLSASSSSTRRTCSGACWQRTKPSQGVNLRFGGAWMIDGEPSDLGRIGRTNGAIGSDALSDRVRRIRERDVCLPRPAGRKWLPVSPGASIRPSIGNSFTTWTALGMTGCTSTRSPSWRKRRPRAWPTVAKHCIWIPAGTTISPLSCGAKNGWGREGRLSNRCSRNSA